MKRKLRSLDFVKTIFSTQTMFAIGMDPKTGMIHGCVKGDGFERKWSEPVTPQIKAVLVVIQSLLGA